MTTLIEIREAIEKLSPEEKAVIAAEISLSENDSWDKQMQDDATTGKLDSLFNEAEAEHKAGKSRAWPTNS